MARAETGPRAGKESNQVLSDTSDRAWAVDEMIPSKSAAGGLGWLKSTRETAKARREARTKVWDEG